MWHLIITSNDTNSVIQAMTTKDERVPYLQTFSIVCLYKYNTFRVDGVATFVIPCNSDTPLVAFYGTSDVATMQRDHYTIYVTYFKQCCHI